jgi:transposase
MGRPAGWMKELTGRSAMKSPGKPSHRREVELWFWREIAKGLSTEDAAAAVGVSSAAGVRWFRERGGMATLLRDPDTCRYLCFAEREEIALLRAEGKGVRAIAREIGRSPSTISRELRRNAATRGGKLEYRASVAQWKAELVARRPKTAKLAANVVLREYVQERLAGHVRRPDGTAVAGPAVKPWKGRNKPRRQDRRWAQAWSPEQISARLRVDFPDDPDMQISHEAIYQSLFVQGRGALARELTACLRTGRALRVPRARVGERGKGFISKEVMISQRPAEVADRAVPGHWEGDLIIGTGRSAIDTTRPGELVGIDCFFVGRLLGAGGPVWQLTAIDTYSSFAWAELVVTGPKGPTVEQTSRFAHRVAAELRHAGWRLERVLSDNGTEFGRRAFGARLPDGVRHTQIRSGRPQTNGHVERLHRTILEECRRPAFARYLHVRLTGLRRDLARYLHDYNHHREHHGRITQGRVPADLVYGARKMEPR